MDYEKKYNKLVEAVKQLQKANPSDECIHNWINDNVPELAESEEWIRSELISLVRLDGWHPIEWTREKKNKMIAWLEKQGEQKSKKVPIWKHWKNGIAGNCEGEPIYLTKVGNTYSLNSCLGFECDYIELSELDNLMLEKQGEQNPYSGVSFSYNDNIWGMCARDNGVDILFNKKLIQHISEKPTDKIKPKFKVGDWVVQENVGTYKVVEVCESWYEVIDNQNNHYSIGFDKEYLCHLWAIQDAKEGDVLCDSHEAYDNPLIFILKKFEHVNFGLVTPSDYSSYCFLTAGDKQRFKEGTYHHKHNIKPATKEQRDLLFQKMYEAGYTFDFEKKELKKIKFRVGDEIITENEESLTITKIDKEGYWSNDLFICDFDSECVWDLVEKKPTEWSLPYEKNKTAEKLIALAEILEMDGDCLFNGVSGNSYGKFLRVLAKELTEVKLAWSKEDEKWAKYLKEMLDYNFRNFTKFEPDAVGAYNWLETIKQRIGG